MVRYLMRISYVGTKYRGCQKAPEFLNETVQGALESALQSLEICNTPNTSFASRTDKGVHAITNAFHVDLEHKIAGEVYQPHLLKGKLNSYLLENEHEILVKNVQVVPQNFHARLNAQWRSYIYRLAVLKPEVMKIEFTPKMFFREYLPVNEMNRCHVIQSGVNLGVIKQVADLYCGIHDFSTFTKGLSREPWRGGIRMIDEFKFYKSSCQTCDIDPQYSNITMWQFYIKSRSFLYHQVRKLVGTALSAGFGLLNLSDVEFMLKNPAPDNWKKSYLAPACGLYLANIQYDTQDFKHQHDLAVVKEETK